jgi:hypothetical protein
MKNINHITAMGIKPSKLNLSIKQQKAKDFSIYLEDDFEYIPGCTEGIKLNQLTELTEEMKEHFEEIEDFISKPIDIDNIDNVKNNVEFYLSFFYDAILVYDISDFVKYEYCNNENILYDTKHKFNNYIYTSMIEKLEIMKKNLEQFEEDLKDLKNLESLEKLENEKLLKELSEVLYEQLPDSFKSKFKTPENIKFIKSILIKQQLN